MAVLVLGGCEIQRQIEADRRQAAAGRCLDYGFKPGTPDFARCVMQTDQAMERRDDEENYRAFESIRRSYTPPPTTTSCQQIGTFVNCRTF